MRHCYNVHEADSISAKIKTTNTGVLWSDFMYLPSGILTINYVCVFYINLWYSQIQTFFGLDDYFVRVECLFLRHGHLFFEQNLILFPLEILVSCNLCRGYIHGNQRTMWGFMYSHNLSNYMQVTIPVPYIHIWFSLCANSIQ